MVRFRIVAPGRVRHLLRFVNRIVLIIFIIAVAALPFPPPLLAFLLKKDPRNKIAEVGRKKPR